MELASDDSSQNDSLPRKQENHFIITSSNYELDNNKSFDDCISVELLSLAPDRTSLEDVVSLDTCIALKSDPSGEPCRLDFKVTNKQKIARIAVVSEASVLEFFKQSGEYACTSFADFVDEFQDHSVYFAEAKIDPPSTEASIKFTRTKNKSSAMWIYGIKLILTNESMAEIPNTFNADVIQSFLTNINPTNPDRIEMAKRVLELSSASEQNCGDAMNSCLNKLTAMNSQRFQEVSKSNDINKLNGTHETTKHNDYISQELCQLKMYIDDKFSMLEKRLMEQIELKDKQTNQKLDDILKHLQINVNNK